MSSPLTIAVLGAGARGADAYGQFALNSMDIEVKMYIVMYGYRMASCEVGMSEKHKGVIQ